MTKAFIFDMDGVIIDSEPIHLKAKDTVCRKYGIYLTEKDFAHFTGRSSRENFSEIIATYNIKNVSAEDLINEKHAMFRELISKDDSIKPIHGLINLLDRIKNKGYKIALASSSIPTMIELTLTRFGIKDYFEVIVSGYDLPKSKPDPAIYLMTAEKLGVVPSECIVIEDATAGIAAAKAAGMYCIGYDNPNSLHQDLSKADKIVKSHDEILNSEP